MQDRQDILRVPRENCSVLRVPVLRVPSKGRIYQVFLLYTPTHIYIAPIDTKIGEHVVHADTNKRLSSDGANVSISGILGEIFNQYRY